VISRKGSIGDSEQASGQNKVLDAVNQEKNPLQEPQGADLAQLSAEELWKNKRFCCDQCRQPGDLHFRVSTTRLKDWILVCESCWLNLRSEEGYRYGGTRKANRRKRRRK
tara:strand:+ start:219 stop:548 length:330 start_codon:yes stop_codon:yes gene_type:complete